MLLEQKKGPFSAGSSFRVGGTDGRGYVHIGIQIPKSQPIAGEVYCDTIVAGHKHNNLLGTPLDILGKMPPADIRISTSGGTNDYKVNATGILEFDTQVGNSIKITILRDLPAETIIDLVYKPEGE